jgi:hypothetical protein
LRKRSFNTGEQHDTGCAEDKNEARFFKGWIPDRSVERYWIHGIVSWLEGIFEFRKGIILSGGSALQKMFEAQWLSIS